MAARLATFPVHPPDLCDIHIRRRVLFVYLFWPLYAGQSVPKIEGFPHTPQCITF